MTIQDSHIELHKLLLQEQERASWSPSCRSPSLVEQEKQRSFKQKDDLINIHKLQQQFQQERHRWHRECEQRQQEHEMREGWLLEKEREFLFQEELLCKNRSELDTQLQEYQQNLERLRETQKMVEKEQETVKLQQQILRHWKHSRQSSLPTVISPGNHEVCPDISRGNFLSMTSFGSFRVNLLSSSWAFQPGWEPLLSLKICPGPPFKLTICQTYLSNITRSQRGS